MKFRPLFVASNSIGTVNNAKSAVLEKSIKPNCANSNTLNVKPRIMRIYPILLPIFTIGTITFLILNSNDLEYFCDTCPSSWAVTEISETEEFFDEVDSETISLRGS